MALLVTYTDLDDEVHTVETDFETLSFKLHTNLHESPVGIQLSGTLPGPTIIDATPAKEELALVHL